MRKTLETFTETHLAMYASWMGTWENLRIKGMAVYDLVYANVIKTN